MIDNTDIQMKILGDLVIAGKIGKFNYINEITKLIYNDITTVANFGKISGFFIKKLLWIYLTIHFIGGYIQGLIKGIKRRLKRA